MRRARRGTGPVRRFNSWLFYQLANRLTEGSIPRNVSDFRLVDRRVYETVNTEQTPLLRKSRHHRLQAEHVAEVLSGLNWLCNEELEKRKVACSLWEMISPDGGAKVDSYY